MPVSVASDDAHTTDHLVERLFGALTATLDVFSVYLGDRLGYYRAMADGSPVTSAELAARTSTAERYAREWLEQQAVTGFITVDVDLDVDVDADTAASEATRGANRRFRLPSAHAEVFTDTTSLNYLAPYSRLVIGTGLTLPAVLEAFRTGGGVDYAAYGADVREGIADGNRPIFQHLLGSEWLPAIPGVHARLLADPPARVADVGCGVGWSSIAIARAYPNARVDGIDLDAASIATATQNAAAAGVGDRVTFHARNAADPLLAGQYDLACAFECLHDMSDPVGALRAMHGLTGAGGTVLIADERTADAFEAPGDDTARIQYGFSITHCLPVGMTEQPSAATGTVMRTHTLREYAAAAGFRAVDVLPIENDSWRFYHLTP